MIHLTLTGEYAGRPICSVNRQEATEKGDKFYHADLWYNMNDSNLCPECKKEVDLVDAEIKADLDRLFGKRT